MLDPYSELGINSYATDDEVKKAYRKLSRIYHPDANVNNPDKEKAEEKFKNIQTAYNQIMRERQQGSSYSNFGFGYKTNGYTGDTDENQMRLNAAASYIRSGYYEQALNTLNSISEHSGLWYYYSAIANSGVGNNIVALDYAKRAVDIEPGNQQFRMLLMQLQSGGEWYQNRRSPYQTSNSGSSGYCFRLLIVNLICNLCCGGRFFCC